MLTAMNEDVDLFDAIDYGHHSMDHLLELEMVIEHHQVSMNDAMGIFVQ